ncbi:Cupredoxin [Phycomyces nitens]|nr:Cupredoxin [Phycomyces nitens]
MAGFYFLYIFIFLPLVLCESVARLQLSDSEINGVRSYELNVSNSRIDPDCFQRSTALLVNGQLPGPTIRVNRGDRVRITVRNLMPDFFGTKKSHGGNPNDLSIHFHGIRQYGSGHADGVPYVTQHPIPPGYEYTHDFRVVNQAGTYFYHAHVGLEEETVFGPFIVYDSDDSRPLEAMPPGSGSLLSSAPARLHAGPFTYDDERIIALSEWWHRDRYALEDYMMGSDFSHLPDAESVLINGKTIYKPPNVSDKCEGYSVIPVEANKTYRLRIIGSTTFRTLGFGIAHHNLTIIEVDGELVKPFETSYVEVAAGQRISVLLHTDQKPQDYTIGTIRLWAEDANPHSNGLAILRYTYDSNDLGRNKAVPEDHPEFPSRLVAPWIWPQLEPYNGVDPIVYQPASRTIVLRSTEAKQQDGSTKWYINGVSYKDPTYPILDGLQSSQRRLPNYRQLRGSNTGYDSVLGTYPIAHYELIDIVIQSTHRKHSFCRSHPWHTHGHSHWLLATGSGEYDAELDQGIRNMPTPLYKDVTMVYPSIDHELEASSNDTEAFIGCGWSKIRILADNPGVWAVHCHNTLHMMMGMMVVFEEAPELIAPFTQNILLSV